MGGGPGGASKMDLAKEAAISAAELLGEYDQIGIVAFEDQPRWVIPPTPATDLGVVQAAICRDAARRRHRDLPGAQDGLRRPGADRRQGQARHPAHRRRGAARRLPRPGPADARRQITAEHDRHRQRRRHQSAPGARAARQRPLLRRQRSVRSAAPRRQRDAAGAARGDRRGRLQAGPHLVEPGAGRHRHQQHAPAARVRRDDAQAAEQHPARLAPDRPDPGRVAVRTRPRDRLDVRRQATAGRRAGSSGPSSAASGRRSSNAPRVRPKTPTAR